MEFHEAQMEFGAIMARALESVDEGRRVRRAVVIYEMEPEDSNGNTSQMAWQATSGQTYVDLVGLLRTAQVQFEADLQKTIIMGDDD